MSSFDIRVFAIRRRLSRRVFEVRWWVAARDKSRSFITRALKTPPVGQIGDTPNRSSTEPKVS